MNWFNRSYLVGALAVTSWFSVAAYQGKRMALPIPVILPGGGQAAPGGPGYHSTGTSRGSWSSGSRSVGGSWGGGK